MNRLMKIGKARKILEKDYKSPDTSEPPESQDPISLAIKTLNRLLRFRQGGLYLPVLPLPNETKDKQIKGDKIEHEELMARTNEALKQGGEAITRLDNVIKSD